MMIVETWIDQMAHVLRVHPNEIRLKNFYLEGQTTQYMQELKTTDVTAKKCFEQLLAQSQFSHREKAIAEFNKSNQYKKRGIYALPTKFGMSFVTLKSFNQASALVHVY